MPSAMIATSRASAVGRPLKLLVPLIVEELRSGDSAGLEHYRRAGALLLEAREQVAAFKWGAWLSQNFELSRTTAHRYMRLAERAEAGVVAHHETSLNRALGRTDLNRGRDAWKPVAAAARAIDREAYAEERQSREDEVRLHRDLAAELIDLGYRALATRLHPDKGGSRDAMRRLNRVREELKSIAQARRFV